MAAKTPADRAHPVARTRVRAPRARGLLATAIALAVGVSGAVLAAGGSYAHLNATTAMGGAGTIAAGSAELLVSHGGDTPESTVAIPAGPFQDMLPGDRRQQEFALHNSGSVPMGVSAFIGAPTAWNLRLAAGACPSTALPGNPLGTTSSAVVSNLQPGATAAVCLEVSLPLTADASTAGTTADHSITLDGIQVAP